MGIIKGGEALIWQGCKFTLNPRWQMGRSTGGVLRGFAQLESQQREMKCYSKPMVTIIQWMGLKLRKRGGHPYSSHLQWCISGHSHSSGRWGSCGTTSNFSKPKVFYVSFSKEQTTHSPHESRRCSNWRQMAEDIIRRTVLFTEGRWSSDLCHAHKHVSLSRSYNNLCGWHVWTTRERNIDSYISAIRHCVVAFDF